MENKTAGVNKFKTFLAIRLFLLVLCFVLLVSGCGKRGVGEKTAERIEKVVKDEVGDSAKSEIDIKHKVHHFKLEGFTKNSKNQWCIEGDLAKFVDPDIILSNIKGRSFDKDISVNLTADKGIYNRNSGSTELKGSVIIVTSDGGRVTMDIARWNAEKEEVKTDSYVKIEHSGITLEGNGAHVLPRQKWAMLKKQIKASDASDRIITCDGPLEVDYGERKVIFNNNVKIIDTEGTMYANKVVAYFDPDKRVIERIEWIGDVKAVY